jgi:serine/threonine protein kinase/Tol biopolymer transport system component
LDLRSGSLLLHYRLVEKLGEGGMGVVWRAVDTTLDRDVAVKILPDVFASDPDRAARFEREAKLLASLNHTNITTVHSVHKVDSVRFLVMELAQGENLASRLADGPLPIDDVVHIARQIAEALEAAHESGIVHRDLKPANITVTADGKVEVLDFGLAKALDSTSTTGAVSDISQSPTQVTGHTAVGVIIGTAAYMSPEQARGRPVDRRADIWAFGCVVYEMLTGKKAFDGETVTDVLAAVVTRGPDWSALPSTTPRRLRALVERCLEKDPKKRLRDAGEARIVLEDIIARPTEPAVAETATPPAAREKKSRVRSLVPWGIALLALLFAWRAARNSRDASPPTFMSITLPRADVADAGMENLLMDISRDGRTLAYCARRDDIVRLYVRSFDEREAVELAGTEGASNPFFSPDGQWVAFAAGAKLKKVSVRGGPVFELRDLFEGHRAGVWLDDGSIICVPSFASPLFRIPAGVGGAGSAVTVIDTAAGERTHRWPGAFPGGEWVYFTVGAERNPGDYEDAEIAAVSLKTGERRSLIQGASMARYAKPGHMLFSRGGVLMSAPVDPDNPKLLGPAVPVLDKIAGQQTSGAVHFATSETGTLAFVTAREGEYDMRLAWVDRWGKVTVLAAPPRRYVAPRLSRDGKQVFVTVGPAFGRGDLWRYDVDRETLTRLTFDDHSIVGVWMPDQRHMLFQREAGAFQLMMASTEGDANERMIYQRKIPVYVSDVSPDGKWIIISDWGSPQSDIYVVPTDGGDPTPVVTDPFGQFGGMVSPDGRWIAYTSSETGSYEVHVRPFLRPGNRWQVSSGGGIHAMWGPSSRELCYLSGSSMMSVAIDATGDVVQVGRPRKLFDLPTTATKLQVDYRDFDMTSDGTRFIATYIANPELARRRIDVLFNDGQLLERAEKKGIAE